MPDDASSSAAVTQVRHGEDERQPVDGKPMELKETPKDKEERKADEIKNEEQERLKREKEEEEHRRAEEVKTAEQERLKAEELRNKEREAERERQLEQEAAAKREQEVTCLKLQEAARWEQVEKELREKERNARELEKEKLKAKEAEKRAGADKICKDTACGPCSKDVTGISRQNKTVTAVNSCDIVQTKTAAKAISSMVRNPFKGQLNQKFDNQNLKMKNIMPKFDTARQSIVQDIGRCLKRKKRQHTKFHGKLVPKKITFGPLITLFIIFSLFSAPVQAINSTNTGNITTVTTIAGRGYNYIAAAHGVAVAEGFQRLWQEAIMFDTQLLVQGQIFNVHRSYLAACSHYFFSMFTKKMQNQMELKGVSATGLHALLEYAYRGMIVINDSNLQDVLEAADHLQFTEVLSFGEKYLRDEITVDNCLHFLRMAEAYGLSECRCEIKNFILENFVPVAHKKDFKLISGELFYEFLSDDRLKAQSRLEVFKIALAWLEYQFCKSDITTKILGSLQLQELDSEEMEYIHSHPLLVSEACHEVLQGALNYHNMKRFSQPIINTPIAKMRAYKECLVILGAGYLDNTLCATIMAGHAESVASVSPTKDNHCFAAVAVVNNIVYVLGGQTAMAGDGTNNALYYDPCDSKWPQITSMTVPRTHFALVTMATCQTAVGGEYNRISLNSGEKYDFATNEWSLISGLSKTPLSHASCLHGGNVDISGGCSGTDFAEFTDKITCFKLNSIGWQQKMNKSLKSHIMLAFNNHLFICFGNTSDKNFMGHTGNPIPLPAEEGDGSQQHNENPADAAARKTVKWSSCSIGYRALGALLGALLGAGAAVTLTRLVVRFLGFGPAGIAAGSIAAKMMSYTGVRRGGAVTADSIVSCLQSIGSTGFTKPGLFVLGLIGGLFGSMVVMLLAWFIC